MSELPANLIKAYDDTYPSDIMILQPPQNITLISRSSLPPNVSPSCERLGDCRSITDIIWSCLSVIIACTWTSIHPNIPSPNDGFWKRLRTRIRITLIGLIAPELIVIWAAKQWKSARWIKKRLEELSAVNTESPNEALEQGIQLLTVSGQPEEKTSE